jgi:hypothetical protein
LAQEIDERFVVQIKHKLVDRLPVDASKDIDSDDVSPNGTTAARDLAESSWTVGQLDLKKIPRHGRDRKPKTGQSSLFFVKVAGTFVNFCCLI